MKHIAIVLILTVGLASCSSTRSPEQLAKKEQEYRVLKKMVDNKYFKLEADWAHPLSSPQINLIGNPNYFIFSGDSISGNLPYYGVRRFGSIHNNEGGIVLDGRYSEFSTSEKPDKNEITLSFEVQEKNEFYDIDVTLYTNKRAMINVKSSQRDIIHYDADIIETTKPKK